MNLSYSNRVRATLIAQAVSMALVPGVVFSQESASTSGETALQEIVVTGSRIRGVAPVGSNLIEIGRAELDLTSAVSTTEVLREVPQVVNLGTDESHRGGQNAQLNSSFASGVNLRGIGGSTTLLLVNGRRIAPSGTQGQYTDPSVIPSIALERVEVVADGASAIYGSDAVAGVVNVITRKNFDGAETRVRFGSADGADRRQISQLLGTSWSSGNALLALEHTYRSELQAADRRFYREDLTAFGGTDYRDTQCNPGTLVAGGNTYALPNGDGTGVDPGSLVAGTANRCDTLALGMVLPEQERNSAVLYVEQDISDRLSFNAEAFYSKREFENVAGGRTASLVMRNTNPYFVSPVPGATSVTVNYLFPDEFGRARVVGSAELFQVTAGLNAELWGDWNANLSGTFGESEDVVDARNIANTANVAISAASADPALAINPFGSGNNTPASAYEFIRGRTVQTPSTEMRLAALQADGSVFELPGGNVRLALGAEHRSEDLETPFTTYRPGTPTTRTVGGSDRTIKSAFAEVFVPVFSGSNAVAGVERLELSIAYRYDEYDDFGSTTNPKFGLTWAPSRDVAFRASYGESFRAPNLSELDPSNISIFQRSKIDPTSPSGTSMGLLLAGGNPGLSPETAKTWTAGIDFTPSFLDGLQLSATYFSVDYEEQVVDLFPVTDILVNEQAYADFITRNPSLAQINEVLNSGYRISGAVNPAVVTFIIDARRQNLAVTKATGVDLKGRYTWDVGAGRMYVGATGTYFTKYDTSAAPGAGVEDRLGTINYPVDFAVRGDVGWGSANWNGRLSIAYTDGYLNTTSTPAQSLPSYTTLDMYLGYTFDESHGKVLDGLALSVDVQNLLDEEPNFVNLPGGYDGEKASALGRLVSVGLTKRW